MLDIIVEIILEIYLELMTLIIPEKNVTQKYVWIAKIAAVTVVLIVFALVIWGVILITDYGNMCGVWPIGIATVLSVAQIIAGIILYKKHH